ncbi:MAG: serine protease [Proteobacteria bacterium]|nr:serine protease [Pseudomonadota bacterium]
MRTSREWVAVGLAAVLVLAGCGGGSGGGGVAGVAQSAAAPETATATQPASAEFLPAATLPAGTSAGAGAGSQPTRLIEGRISDGAQTTDVTPFVGRDAQDAPPARQIRLGVLSAADVPLQKASTSGPVPVRIGTGRELQDTADQARVAAQLDWRPSRRGGKVAALRFQSEGALGVRVGLRVYSLPLGGLVRFHTDGSNEAYQVAAQEIQATIQRNLDAGDTGEDAHTWWSPNLGGDAVTVEFEVPPGVPTDTVEVAVPALSHIYLDAKDVASLQQAAGSCTKDVNCYLGEQGVSASSQAVAQLDFQLGSGTYVCTGTLMNDDRSSGTPYLLTANHCISSQTSASSLATYWFYRSAGCNSPVISPAAIRTKTGAALLYNSSQTDTSFLRLYGMPPAGVRYAASAPGGLSGTQTVFSISNPGGGWQQYSSGVSTGPISACPQFNSSGACIFSTPSNFLRVNWSVGTTLGGSSGGGLFMNTNGTPYLVGQLYGGFSSCSAPNDNEYFGRFDVAYNAALYQWLGGTPTTTPTTPTTPGSHVPIYRFYNTKTGTHFYTVSTAERDSVRAKYPQYSYEGIGFYADASQSASTTPVYRFYNTKTGAHFFTVSAQERDQVRAKYAQFSYEGVAWYVNGGAGGTASPMYRFYNVQTETHFYTISGTERANVIAKYPQFHDEGIAYYAWTSP